MKKAAPFNSRRLVKWIIAVLCVVLAFSMVGGVFLMFLYR